jgi:hypothetical protein
MLRHQRWRTYAKAFIDLAEHCGVKHIVSIGALLAGAPHTRPVPVTARCPDPTWRALMEAWGIYRPPTYEGPTGTSTVLLDAAEKRVIALLTHVARLLDLSLDMCGFPEAIKDFRAQCDRAVARNKVTREHVQQLEKDYDEAAGEKPQGLPDGVDSDQLISRAGGLPAQAARRRRGGALSYRSSIPK